MPGPDLVSGSPLIDVAALAEALAGPNPPLVIDVRWRLGDPPGAGAQRYAEGHLPGSVFADIETVFTRHTGVPTDGRHPLPDPAELGPTLAGLGLTPGREAVVVDEPGSFAAERAWWVLRWVGLPARVLDGGVPAWHAAGLPLATGSPTASGIASGAEALPNGGGEGLVLRPGSMPTIDADGAAADGLDPRTALVDARAAERFRGEVEPLDPVAGHIPGAVNVPVAGLFVEGRLPDADTLRELFEPLAGADRVSAYCGSGVSAARLVLALAAAGIDARLFPGSWSAWSNDPARPVATGPD